MKVTSKELLGKLRDRRVTCGACGSEMLELRSPFIATMSTPSGAYQNDTIPMVWFRCRSCGHLMPFCPNSLGLIKLKEVVGEHGKRE